VFFLIVELGIATPPIGGAALARVLRAEAASTAHKHGCRQKKSR